MDSNKKKENLIYSHCRLPSAVSRVIGLTDKFAVSPSFYYSYIIAFVGKLKIN